MQRMYRLKAASELCEFLRRVPGDKRELAAVNSGWMVGFLPWNPGQQMVIPSTWAPLPDEYPSGG